MDHGANGTTKYYDLGKYQRTCRTDSAEALKWVNRGLVWSYSFNHEAALRCFEQAAQDDKKCAMAYWGQAYAISPNYNKPWWLFTADEREIAIKKALEVFALAEENVTDFEPMERALLTALATRFPPDVNTPGEKMSAFDYAYAEAMKKVYEEYGDDPDVATLYADSVMCTRPRQLWNLDTGEPTGDDVVAARHALEKAMASASGRENPGTCHLYIHMMEMTLTPELALPAANRLRRLVPDGSHMQHMATHIDVACGDYGRAIDSGLNAIISDDVYFSREKVDSFIYNAYRAHNVHAMSYAAMMAGRREEALYGAKRLGEILTEEYMTSKPRMADWTEWQAVTMPHVLIRFGQWEDILDLQPPKNPKLSVIATTIKYAKGIALAVLGRIEEAQIAQAEFEEARRALPEDRLYGPSSKAAPVFAIASAMLEGELQYRQGNYTEAFASLRHGIELEGQIAYADPPLWMQPVRHALGALLLEQGQTVESEKVYLEDLGLSKTLSRRKARLNNVWALHGLYECLIANNKHEEAQRLRIHRDIALASADIPIGASCFCRLKVKAKTCKAC
ncbi:similar to TPR domain protein [Plenodomus lingam JN3]|uniref:Similar to TPR domain protein n=1 Tax=Leptosphaeria maculans (strain JN3 / isolate v23.1.3 / race Av1-4-5-6-7-8) TaxID=985895 RepID=E4ZW65_LEPMJ|nr:similar to TPR domain protein [Plenodomus lingam JN3]CBX95841.1 similar to TPR domain protein [Plenodomus lingam JN3]